MHITINGPEVQECESLVKKAVKKWHEVKARRKIAKSIPASETSSNCPTVSNAAVQVDMLPPLALDVPEQVNAMGDGIGVKDSEKEVNSVISALKLPISRIWMTLTLTMTQTLSQIQTEQLQVSFNFQNGQQS